MIGYMERTCRDTVLPLLDLGYDTVGTQVTRGWHLAASPDQDGGDVYGGK